MATNEIELTDAIVNLRRQLQQAIDAGQDQDLRFKVLDIDIEFKCIVRKEANSKVGAKFWLLNAEAGGTIGNETIQTIKLRLQPTDGTDKPVQLSDEGSLPA